MPSFHDRVLVATVAVAILAAVATVLLGRGLAHDTSLAQLFGSAAEGGTATEGFPSDESLLVIAEDDDTEPVFNQRHAAWLHALVETLDGDPAVESVVSLANLPDVRFRLAIPRFGDSVLPRDVAGWSAEDRAERRQDPFLLSGLIAADGRASASWIMLDRRLKYTADYRARLTRLVERIRAVPAPPSLRVTVAGYPLVYAAMTDIAWRDALVLTLAALLVIALVARLGGVRWPLVIAFVAAWPIVALIAVGVFAVFDLRLHVFSNAALPILMVTGGASFVHLALRLGRERGAPGDVRATFVACALSVTTTAISFAVLTASELQPIRRLGLEVALGSILSFAVVSAMLFGVMARRASSPRRFPNRAATEAQDDGADGAVGVASGRAILQHRRVATWIVAVVLGAPWFLLAPDRLLRSASFLERLPADHAAVVDARRAKTVLGETTAFEVILEYPNRAAMTAVLERPDGIAALASFERVLIDEVASSDYVLSPLTIVRFVNHRLPSFLGGGAFEVTERAGRIASGALTGTMLVPGALRAWVRELAGERRLRFGLRIPDLPPGAIQRAVLEIEGAVATAHRERLGGPRVSCTGYAVLMARTALATRAQQVRSVGWSGLALALLLLVVVRAFVPWSKAIVVNALALVSVVNVVWLIGSPLDLFSTVLIASLLGLLIDDNVHLLVAYRRASRSMPPGAAAEAAVARVGGSIRLSSIALAAGFGVFALSALPGYRWFAVCAVVAVGLILFWDLECLPRWLWRKTRAERL